MRCKACNNILKEKEIVWIPELNIHEELCSSCRQALYDAETDALGDILDIYPDDPVEY
jgi:hypothetical protein